MHQARGGCNLGKGTDRDMIGDADPAAQHDEIAKGY